MVVFLLVTLFCVALIITLIGLRLSPHPRTRVKHNVAYAPRPVRGPGQGDPTRNVRRRPVEDQPYRQSQRPYAAAGYVGVERGQGRRPALTGVDLGAQGGHVVIRGGVGANDRKGREGASPPSTQRRVDIPPPNGGASPRPSRSRGVDDLRTPDPLRRIGRAPIRPFSGVEDIVSLWSARLPHWLKLTLLSGTIFSLCLFLFVQVAYPGFLPVMAIINNFAPQPNSVSTNPTVYGENLGPSDASKSLVRIAQGDSNQYNSQDEYNQWVGSACSPAAMAEIINAYGHNYRITDILKVEAGLHEITPELGLLEGQGIDRTMDRFDFKMVPLEHATLDNAIAVANRGHPVIVSFANSGYWPGGHILVLHGGDAQNVDLADSSRLNLTVVARGQFLQWWNGFTALAVPK